MATQAATSESRWDFSGPNQSVKWPYSKWFAAHIGKRIQYAFVREHWDRDIAELAAAQKLAAEESDPVPASLSQGDRDVLGRVAKAGIRRLMELLELVAKREAAETLCEGAGIYPAGLKSLLRKVYKYLPFGAQMRQLVAADDRALQDYVSRLTSRKLGHSLALLEVGRTKEGRRRLSADTGIPEDAMLDLVRRADLTRLRLMGGGMVRQTWALGYRGLKDLQRASAEEYYARCQEYYRKTTKGKPFDLTPDTARGHISRMRQALPIVEE